MTQEEAERLVIDALALAMARDGSSGRTSLTSTALGVHGAKHCLAACRMSTASVGLAIRCSLAMAQCSMSVRHVWQ